MTLVHKRRKTWRVFGVEVGTDGMGPLYIALGLGLRLGFNIHVLPKFEPGATDRWGYRETWCDGPIYSFGLGPLLYVCWSD